MTDPAAFRISPFREMSEARSVVSGQLVKPPAAWYNDKRATDEENRS